MELFLRMVSEGKLPNKQTINILMELLDEAGQYSKVCVFVLLLASAALTNRLINDENALVSVRLKTHLYEVSGRAACATATHAAANDTAAPVLPCFCLPTVSTTICPVGSTCLRFAGG